jgi:hypothetical protein
MAMADIPAMLFPTVRTDHRVLSRTVKVRFLAGGAPSMPDRMPLTIEVLGGGDGKHPVVFDRVTGGTIYLDEAKRIGRRLFEIADGDIRKGFRILDPGRQVLYEWHAGDSETTDDSAD